jgi:tripartite-type tricarboxylate transporter receptor subunit TctC
MRRALSQIALCLGTLVGWTGFSGAQDTAPKLIRIIVPFSAGAGNDAIAGPLRRRLDVCVIVENGPGAVGADAVAKSPRG